MQSKMSIIKNWRKVLSISVSKELRFVSEDIELFQRQSIQVIIDYKWETYTKNFFIMKFLIFITYIIVFFWDIEMLYPKDGSLRLKDDWYYFRKGVCFSLQFYLLFYEIKTMFSNFREYIEDKWNYFELA